MLVRIVARRDALPCRTLLVEWPSATCSRVTSRQRPRFHLTRKGKARWRIRCLMRYLSWLRNVRTPKKGQDPYHARRIQPCAAAPWAVLVNLLSSSTVSRTKPVTISFTTLAEDVVTARCAFDCGTTTVFRLWFFREEWSGPNLVSSGKCKRYKQKTTPFSYGSG